MYNGVLAEGGNFLAQLYVANGSFVAESSLMPAGTPVNFQSGSFAGYVQTSGTTSQGNVVNPNVQVTSQTSGPITLQLRVWSSAFATYADAQAANGERGKSPLFSLTPGYSPNPPTDMAGFTWSINPIPEPSTVALGILGMGSLIFLRRRK